MSKLTKVKKERVETGDPERLPDEVDPHAPAVGRWFWVTPTRKIKDDEGNWKVDENDEYIEERDPDNKWLGCCTDLGTNYAEITSVQEGNIRLHFDTFADWAEFEPDHMAYIQSKQQHYQTKVRSLMRKVAELTKQLGVGTMVLNAPNETQALALSGNGVDPKDYKDALVKAKDETLPDLFKKIEQANEKLATWLKAQMIPLKAEARAMREVIGAVENRIFNVELYAGLVEQVIEIRKGQPADIGEPVRIFQRRAYMDEECLAQYEAGGMEFKDIREFNEWMARPLNMSRLLPFPRCIVAFQVRRKDKERKAANFNDFIRLAFGNEREADKQTFLYIRNGEQLFMLQTGIDFDEKLFPDMDRQMLNGKIYAKTFASCVDRIVSEGEYLQMVEDDKECKRQYAEASEDDKWKFRNYTDLDRMVEYTQDTVYFDDITNKIKSDMDKHNRLTLVLQGLADRSPVFHPHPVWKLWTEDFQKAIVPVYDDSRALVDGDKPDFEAYRKRLNASIKEGTVTVGQMKAWDNAEAKKQADRQAANWRHSGPSYYSRPYGNPGPGTLAKVVKVTRKGDCTYEWNRQRQQQYDKWGRKLEPFIKTSIVVPSAKLFNVEAYKPGDFRQFFADPRTRAEYLKWAPYMLIAEDYHAGKRELGKSGYRGYEAGEDDDSE